MTSDTENAISAAAIALAETAQLLNQIARLLAEQVIPQTKVKSLFDNAQS